MFLPETCERDLSPWPWYFFPLSWVFVYEAFTYTPFGELATYQARSAAGTLLDLALAYDGLGRLTEKRENGITTTYSAVVSPACSETAARRTPIRTTPTGTARNGGRAADGQDRITSRAGATYTYSAKGERLTKTEGASLARYTYDGRGHLAAAALPGALRIDYDLDAYGRRITKRRNGTAENRFLYRTALQPAAEVDAAGNVLTRYVYARGELGPDLLERGGASFALLKDERGSIRFVVDVFSGVVVQALEYDAFGKVTSDTNPGFQAFGFAGGIYDADTGLTHEGLHRRVEPRRGRQRGRRGRGRERRTARPRSPSRSSTRASDASGRARSTRRTVCRKRSRRPARGRVPAAQPVEARSRGSDPSRKPRPAPELCIRAASRPFGVLNPSIGAPSRRCRFPERADRATVHAFRSPKPRA